MLKRLSIVSTFFLFRIFLTKYRMINLFYKMFVHKNYDPGVFGATF